MASSINALTGSGGGVVTTADASGVLQLQSNGTTVASVSSTGVDVTGNSTVSGTLNVTGTISSSGQIAALKSMTSQTSTTGTTVTFSSIPSWVKRITVALSGVAYTGGLSVQLGTSGGLVTTGYTAGSGIATNGNTTSVGAKSGGFGTEGTASTITGIWTIVNISGNTWVASWTWSNHGNQFGGGGGYIGLTGALTQVAAAAGAFTAGNINVLYE